MSSHLEYTSNIRALRPHHAIPTLLNEKKKPNYLVGSSTFRQNLLHIKTNNKRNKYQHKTNSTNTLERIKFQNILPLFKIPYSYNNNNNTISNITPESLPNFSLYFPNLLLTITRPPFT
ncbi:unnamed protein product [Rhizophagus irregularis]|nr:unnamed protein product [Rhizophagus irregularis]